MRSRIATVFVAGAVTVALALTSAGAPSVAAPSASETPAVETPAAGPPAAETRIGGTAELPGGKSVVGETSPIHDPALVIADDGTWYVYSTGRVNRENGGTIQISASKDGGTTWASLGTVWGEIPAWIDEHFADGALPDNLWAPEIHEHDGTYYLYYSASRFGTDSSVTALATNTTLDPSDPDYRWVDQGLVIASPVSGLAGGTSFNAIDAGIVEDVDGTPYLAIGSFWNGIFLVPIAWPSGKPVDGWQQRTVNLADRFVPGNPIEAPYITRHGQWFYLFVSFDSCCRGADSTYKIAVGRSRSVTGPYLDEDGRDLYGGGGTVVLDTHGAVTGPGGQSVFGDYLAFHYYDASNEAIPYFPTLGVQKIDWRDGWPSFDQRVQLPAVMSQPKDRTVRSGASVRLTARATGTPRPVAVWEQSTHGGGTWTPVERQPRTVSERRGVRSTLDLRTTETTTTYRARFSNAHGTSTSSEATVTVRGRR